MWHSTYSSLFDQSSDETILCPTTSPLPQSTATTHAPLPRTSYEAARVLLIFQNIVHGIHATYQRVVEIAIYISLKPRLLLASVLVILGIAAEIEQPGFFPRPKELGIALVAIICASSVIINAVALERLGERSRFGIDDVWSVVWRWICDVISYKERIVGKDEYEQVGETTMMFNKRGASVFLLDTPKQYRIGTTIQTPLTSNTQQQVSGGIMSRVAPTRSRSPLFPLPPAVLQPHSSPPPLHRQEHAHMLRASDQKPLHHLNACMETDGNVSDTLIEEKPHASGLLGQSPMPPRRTIPDQWENFSGKGFYKYYRKLEAVSKWQNPGNSRSFEDMPRKVEDMDGRDRG